MTTHYVRSNGQLAAIAEMPTPHLKSAHAKLVRDEAHRSLEIAAMAAEIARRDAEAALAQADAQSEAAQ
jgi:hypothetical protein